MLIYADHQVQELASCAEAAKQLGEASRVCVVAGEQIEKAKKLETMLSLGRQIWSSLVIGVP